MMKHHKLPENILDLLPDAVDFLTSHPNIIKAKEVIVDNDPFERHRFESLTERKYFDFSYKELGQLRRRYLHG
jgi:hypothetical protein